MVPGRFLWRGEWHQGASRALLLAAAPVTALARPSAVQPKSLHVEQFVTHQHWLSIYACPRRLHANLARSETPQRGLRMSIHELQPTTHAEQWSGPRLPQQPPLGTPGECREALGHILQVVDRVVQEVASKRFDGEARAVGARPGPLPLVVAHAIEGGGELLSRHHQGLAHRRRIVLPVALRDGGGVLIPVGEGRIVLRQHQPEALLEQHKHVADVAAIFEGGPDGPPRRWPWGTLAHKRATAEDRAPRLDRRPQGGTNHVARDRPSIETTG